MGSHSYVALDVHPSVVSAMEDAEDRSWVTADLVFSFRYDLWSSGQPQCSSKGALEQWLCLWHVQ